MKVLKYKKFVKSKNWDANKVDKKGGGEQVNAKKETIK